MEWLNIIVSILSGLAVCIPLAIKLVEYVRKLIQEKNWSSVMQIVLRLMTEAEKNYQTGAEKKKYVMDSVETIKSTLNCEVDMNAISVMVDSICDASKIINTKTK